MNNKLIEKYLGERKSINNLFEKNIEIPDDGLHPYELIQLARKKKLIKPNPNNHHRELKDNEYAIPRLNKNKKWGINPLTGRNKKINKTGYLITTVKPEKRTLKNLPRNNKGEVKVRFQDWLMLKNTSKSNSSVGQSPNGEWFGWSHRAISGFKIGDIIKPGTIGNKYAYGDKQSKKYDELSRDSIEKADKYLDKLNKFKPYKIETDKEAMEHAIRFANDVS